jgi:hypothetical protein
LKKVILFLLFLLAVLIVFPSIITKVISTSNSIGTVETPAPPLVVSARTQIGKTLIYDSDYVKLSYPNGDIPIKRGVCTDVVIRALRDGRKIDLQKEVHEDMLKAFGSYPKNWGAKGTDKNIDHRRVPNLKTYFKRQGYALPITTNPKDYRAGDIVTCKINGLAHIMIVSSLRDASDGTPYVIHNFGFGTLENNQLFSFPIDGHYRIK